MKRRKIKIMQRISKNLKYLLAVLVVSVTIVMGLSACAPAEAGTDYGSSMVGTFWSLIPPRPGGYFYLYGAFSPAVIFAFTEAAAEIPSKQDSGQIA